MTPILEAVAHGRNGTIHGYRQRSQPPHPSQLLIELDLEVALKQKEHRHRVNNGVNSLLIGQTGLIFSRYDHPESIWTKGVLLNRLNRRCITGPALEPVQGFHRLALALDMVARHIQQLNGRFVAGATTVMEVINQTHFDITLIGLLNQSQQLDHVRGRDGGNGLQHGRISQGW
jgi:hypothetical protein